MTALDLGIAIAWLNVLHGNARANGCNCQACALMEKYENVTYSNASTPEILPLVSVLLWHLFRDINMTISDLEHRIRDHDEDNSVETLITQEAIDRMLLPLRGFASTLETAARRCGWDQKP